MPTSIKSRVVFAPAGSGKTEQLSERYIELLRCGVSPERILTLTFTEKASAEMKDRILRRLADRNQALYHQIRDNTHKLRISTIHSFCLSLVRRFADLLGLDPRLDVLPDPDAAWITAKHDALVRVAEQDRDSAHYRLLLDLVTRENVQGWKPLSSLLDTLFNKRALLHHAKPVPADTERLTAVATRLRSHPLTQTNLPQHGAVFPNVFNPSAVATACRALELSRSSFMTKEGTPRKKGCTAEQDWNRQMTEYYQLLRTTQTRQDFCQQFELFQSCFLATYEQTKRTLGQVDYNDMELLALRLLEEEPEWQNILRAFDEHTDHLLIDEFQDTSLLQWRIIDKLTEEWRAGQGAKADQGISPSIFIVGDDKQSIYLFRGANVDLFTAAADRLETWLGSDRLERIQLTENYRSLPAIINFNNVLFSRLMSATGNGAADQRLADAAPPAPWRTRYTPFTCQRTNPAPGHVEIILECLEANSAERRERDATNMAKRILTIVSKLTVYDRRADGSESPRPCDYRDIAVLIRQRTHLAAIERALRSAGIPFIVVGGTGFYSEEEVRYLCAAASFLIDPRDDLSLYLTLRSPFFNIPERELLIANQSRGLSLWERIQNCSHSKELSDAIATINRWLDRLRYEAVSVVLEDAMIERELWKAFWEPPREANLRKLLDIIQRQELAGNHPLRIRSFLEKQSKDADEPKADVPTEGQNAVQILTIHAAKGLQFPVVFCPGLDGTIGSPQGNVPPLVIDDSPGRDDVFVSYLPDKEIRNQDRAHRVYVDKQLEEEKRIFYVACTRARDALFLSGIWHRQNRATTRLGWIIDALGLRKEGEDFTLSCQLEGVRCVNATAIPEPKPRPRIPLEQEVPIRIQPVITAPPLRLEPVTRNTPADLHRHSSEHIGLGEVIHRLLEQISSGLLPEETKLAAEAERLLRLAGLTDTRFTDETVSVISKLKSSPVWEIIRPRPDALTELPVMYRDGKTIFSGRIDRLILHKDEVLIYDYKTFPVSREEIPSLQHEYHATQLVHYSRACQHLYPGREITTHLVFTAVPEVVKTGSFPAGPDTARPPKSSDC